MTEVHPQLNRLGDDSKEEVANALAQLQELGFNSINDIEELMRAATDKLTDGCDGELISKILLQLVGVTAQLKQLAGGALDDGKPTENLSPEELMKKVCVYPLLFTKKKKKKKKK